MRCGISFQEIALQLNAAFEFYSTLYAAMLKVLSHFENKKSHQNKKRNGRRRQEESMTLNGRTWKIKNTKKKIRPKRQEESMTLNGRTWRISDAERPRPRSKPN
jgi:hypothetical protein